MFSGSIRRRRGHHEYTSITDAINIDDILPKLRDIADDVLIFFHYRKDLIIFLKI